MFLDTLEICYNRNMEILMLIAGFVVGSLVGFAIANSKKPNQGLNGVTHSAGIVAYGSKNKTKSF